MEVPEKDILGLLVQRGLPRRVAGMYCVGGLRRQQLQMQVGHPGCIPGPVERTRAAHDPGIQVWLARSKHRYLRRWIRRRCKAKTQERYAVACLVCPGDREKIITRIVHQTHTPQGGRRQARENYCVTGTLPWTSTGMRPHTLPRMWRDVGIYRRGGFNTRLLLQRFAPRLNICVIPGELLSGQTTVAISMRG